MELQWPATVLHREPFRKGASGTKKGSHTLETDRIKGLTLSHTYIELYLQEAMPQEGKADVDLTVSSFTDRMSRGKKEPKS